MLGRSLLAGLLLLTGALAARAEYPDKPVKIIVPVAAGGGVDVMARLLAQYLGERLRQQFVVENRPGAAGVIGSKAVIASPADGTTLLYTPSSLSLSVAINSTPPYDLAKDFTPIVNVAISPYALVVNPSVPAQTLKEFIAYAKANPGKLSYGSGGPGSPHHLYAELFASMTGTTMTHVPYKGTLPALNDVIAGHIQLMFSDVPPLLGLASTGKVRPIGVSTKARVAAFPDVPPLNEAGVPGFDVAGWFTVAAPAKTPQPVIARLHAEMKAIMATADMKAQIAKLSLLPMDTPPVPEMQSFVKSEIVRWGEIVKKAGIAGSQ